MRSLIATLLICGLSSVAWSDNRGRELIEAARQGDAAKVEELLANGVDVNSRGRFGITALWQASSKERVEVAKILLEAGANVNVADSTWHATPLMLTENSEIITELVKHQTKGIDAVLNANAQSGKIEVVRAFLEAKSIDPSWLARAKAQAELADRAEVVKLLEETGPDELPELPRPAEADLRTYVGSFIDDRLNQVHFEIHEGRLKLKYETGSAMALVAIDKHLFERGGHKFRFHVNGDKITAVVREQVASQRRYLPVQDAAPLEIGEEDSTIQRDDEAVVAREHWPSFRGLNARGIAADQNLPDGWNVEEDRGVIWKTPIPGLANSCPIVWGDRVFITTAISSAGDQSLKIGLYGAGDAAEDDSPHRWQLMCLDKKTGKVLWERLAREGVPEVKRHTKSTQANSTPATDGEHVVALFNTGDLHCYNLEGEVKWKQSLGVLDSGAFNDPDYQWGFGSSPIIYRDRVIVQCDLQKDSFLAVYDLETGELIWREPRDEPPSWGTPTVFESERGPQILTTGPEQARSYDALSGRVIWRLAGFSSITVPTPQVAHDLVFVTSGYRPIQPIFAIRIDAAGDITLGAGEETAEAIAWSKERGGPYLPTPLVYGNYFYTCSNNGILTCYRAKTGERVYRERFARGGAASFTASPVAADGRIYLTAESGAVYAVQAGPKYELLSVNELGEYCLATPAIAGRLFLARTQKHLVAIGTE
jgi:outer membrane protein assembly factor BamB/ankyrin repeat protein